LLAVALVAVAGTVTAQDGQSPGEDRTRLGAFQLEGVVAWFRKRFSDEELKRYLPEDFSIEHHLCNCNDLPEPHYPYVMTFFSTPKGDLVGRPERRGFDTVIVPLAVRHGERYCELEAEDQCYGSFADPCDFSDHRFGEQLAPYFPTCKDASPQLERTSTH
jgi:hypothetical protein